jgi:hypothetical protein
MRLLISDANILIDMEVGGLLQAMFQLEHQFGVPDVLFVEELAKHHPKLPAMGLKVLPLQAAAVQDALALLTRHGASGVSRNDILSLALARQEGCPLLTGDRRLRDAAEAEQTEVHGTLWLVEQLVLSGVIGPDRARGAYDAMRSNGRRLPWPEVQRQLRRLNA